MTEAALSSESDAGVLRSTSRRAIDIATTKVYWNSDLKLASRPVLGLRLGQLVRHEQPDVSNESIRALAFQALYLRQNPV